MLASTDASPTPAPSTIAETVLRTAALVVAGLLGALSALLEALHTYARVGGGRAPWSVLAAVGGAVVLVWFARYAAGRRWAPLVPAAAWTIVILAASARTSEGDVLMIDTNPVVIGTMLAGFAAFVVTWWVLELRSLRRR